jgi:hypothetical protein
MTYQAGLWMAHFEVTIMQKPSTDDSRIADSTLNGLVGEADELSRTSLDTVRTTFAAMERTVAVVTEDCRHISATLDTLSHALSVLSSESGGAQEWGGFGLIGLPIMGAVRAVKGMASQYVKQQTGLSLDAWTELVASSASQFEDYLSQLRTVAALSARHHGPHPVTDPEQLQEDERILLDARWQTQTWKQVLSRVAQMGQLVDAVLQVDLHRATKPESEAGASRSSGFSATLQRTVKEVQVRGTERTGDLQEWVLRPFVEVRDQVKELPQQVNRLATKVALLELMLDLEIAELRVCAGGVPQAEATVVGLRVAASVLLPELAHGRDLARLRIRTFESYLDRLGDARAEGQVADQAYDVLFAEYGGGLEASRAQLAALDAGAAAWRREGPRVLAACVAWTEAELDLLVARELVGQEVAKDRRAVLTRERLRLDEAATLLHVL